MDPDAESATVGISDACCVARPIEVYFLDFEWYLSHSCGETQVATWVWFFQSKTPKYLLTIDHMPECSILGFKVEYDSDPVLQKFKGYQKTI
ncbi:hypothetical protein VULLAG_LOCUS3963 [Vulpes lagopus]